MDIHQLIDTHILQYDRRCSHVTLNADTYEGERCKSHVNTSVSIDCAIPEIDPEGPFAPLCKALCGFSWSHMPGDMRITITSHATRHFASVATDMVYGCRTETIRDIYRTHAHDHSITKNAVSIGFDGMNARTLQCKVSWLGNTLHDQTYVTDILSLTVSPAIDLDSNKRLECINMKLNDEFHRDHRSGMMSL